MPKSRGTPQWGHSPEGFSDIDVGRDDAARLGRDLNVVDTEEVTRLQESLSKHACWYGSNMQYDARPKLIDVRTALKETMDSLVIADKHLSGLDTESQRLLKKALRELGGGNPSEMFSAGREHVSRLREATAWALRRLPKPRRGPSPDSALKHLCRSLVETYQEFSGKEWTYAPLVSGKGGRDFSSVGAHWVAGAVRVIHEAAAAEIASPPPEQPPIEQLVTAMQDLPNYARRHFESLETKT